MTRSGWVLAMLLAVTACSPEAEQPATNRAGATAADAPAAQEDSAAVPSLEGNWTVANIDGASLTQFYPMAAAVSGDRFTITSECVNMAWSYTQDRNIVGFTPASANACRARTHNEDQIERVINLANIAMFTGDTVELSGAGGRATLTRR